MKPLLIAFLFPVLCESASATIFSDAASILQAPEQAMILPKGASVENWLCFGVPVEDVAKIVIKATYKPKLLQFVSVSPEVGYTEAHAISGLTSSDATITITYTATGSTPTQTLGRVQYKTIAATGPTPTRVLITSCVVTYTDGTTATLAATDITNKDNLTTVRPAPVLTGRLAEAQPAGSAGTP